MHPKIQRKAPSASERATSNDETVQANNLLSGKESKTKMQTTRMGPLTFDMNTQLEEDEYVYLTAADDLAKLMRWHYHLGHLASTSSSNLHLTARSLNV